MRGKFYVKKLNENASYPIKATPKAAGYDICSSVKITVPARQHALVKTGLSWACPPNTYARIAPRSGLALKKKIAVGAGVIDEDYRG